MVGTSIKNLDVNTEKCSDVNGSQEFKCKCMDGYDGKRCEVIACSSSYCNNNGLCSKESHNNIERLKCECNEGFDGQRCEIDLCDSLICVNGLCDAGKCICDANYIKNGNICEETCGTIPCKVFI